MRTPGATGPRKGNRGEPIPSPGFPIEVDPTKRRQLIAEAAYYLAEKRGFAPGGEVADWLEAEAEIKELLGQ